MSVSIRTRVEAHPCPVSPKPCKKMRVAVCFPLADTITGVLILLEVLERKGSVIKIAIFFDFL